MSQFSSNAGDAAPTRDDEQPEPLSFTLTLVSPSVGVTSRLYFPHLPATTTVKQLKAKIRDSLPSRPPDENQRLIHRGRMLAREGETMLEIFGKETLCNPESQTLHLVLRPAEGTPPPAPTSHSAPGPQAIPQPTPRANSHALSGTPLIAQLPRPQSTSVMEGQGLHGQQPLPGFQHVQNNQILHQAEQYRTMLAARLQELQRESQRLQQEMAAATQGQRLYHTFPNGAQLPQIPGVPQGMFQMPQLGMRPPNGVPASVQAFLAQQQRGRAAEGRTGVQDNANTAPGGSIRGISSGRASPNLHRPDHHTTYTREGVGPNGERWQVTVNETTTTLPLNQAQHQHHHHHHPQPPPHTASNPVAEIQAIMRSADRMNATQDTRRALDAMQRSASNPNPDLGRSTPVPETSATGIPPTSVTRAAPTPSDYITPPIATFVMPSGASSVAANVNNASNSDNVVYILASPQGPRALLISNSETYYTPRQHRRHRLPSPTALQGLGEAVGLTEYRNRPNGQRVAARRNRGGAAENQPLLAAPHVNPGAGALAAQIGPILWLVVRLVGFVWFLTSGNPSWTRWFMVSGIALIIFVVNTGIFNGAADQVWGPIRRHLEALIPLAGPDAAMIPAVNAVVPQPELRPANEAERQARARREPDPAETAARLLEQHRQANGGWLLTQIRRAEHSLLLFLASLVPGVGERHIAAREAEAMERQRRIDSAAAAAQEAEQAETGGEPSPTADNQANGESAAPPSQEGEQGIQNGGLDDLPPLVEA